MTTPLIARGAEFVVRGSRRHRNSRNIVNLRPERERDSLVNFAVYITQQYRYNSEEPIAVVDIAAQRHSKYIRITRLALT